jgi:hypothetical protein
MALKGECISTGSSGVCCGKKLEIRVCKSAAGYYIGTTCPNCGPYSRESVLYWPMYDEAKAALESNNWKRRDAEYHPDVPNNYTI